MTSGILGQVTMLKNQTATNNAAANTTKKNDTTDKNMFLTLMLKQMEYQDPTEPTSNEEWLSQMAQYSALESSQNTNATLSNLQASLNAMFENINTANGISQTLSLIGKEVSILNPVTDASGNPVKGEDGKVQTETIKGTVEEASFDTGVGMIKVNGKDYPISYIQSVKNSNNQA